MYSPHTYYNLFVTLRNIFFKFCYSGPPWAAAPTEADVHAGQNSGGLYRADAHAGQNGMGVCMPRGKRPGALFFLILPHERPPEQGGAEKEAEDGEPREAARQRSDVAQQRAADEQGGRAELELFQQSAVIGGLQKIFVEKILQKPCFPLCRKGSVPARPG